MKSSLVVVVSIVAASFILNNPVIAQTSPSSTEAPKTGWPSLNPGGGYPEDLRPDRTKQKRSECRKQAKTQKVSFLNRRRFIHDCMSH